MKAALSWCVMAAVLPWLCGCAVGSFPAIGPAAPPPPPVAAAPPPVAYGAFLEGPIGQKLDTADRDKALAAEQDALASGQRKTWRGDHGTFGYVEPAAAPAPAPVSADATPPAVPAETCKGFTSTIYLSGRPQVGHGRGCTNPDGTYRITG